MDRYSYRRDRDVSSPSFSSTLLDAIYRSIDEGQEDHQLMLYRETMKKKQQYNARSFKDDEEMANFQRICMIEKWMEKKESHFAAKAAAARRDHNNLKRDSAAFFFNKSSSSSSDSSGFSFSEPYESIHGVSLRSSCYGLQRPMAYRDDYAAAAAAAAQQKQKPKNENGGGFVKTKSRALKIYGDLKKGKQPLSPGAKLASFLNSLFTAGNAKKAKIYDDDQSSSGRKSSKSVNASTCSSASSFSRSCLSKTPSSRGKLSNGMKRSVRFYPVSVIVDEDCQPCGHKSLREEGKTTMEAANKEIIRSSINEELKLHIMEKNRRVEEAARDLLRNYQKRVEFEHVNFNHKDDEEEEEDEDDAASYASSDLFELDNLSAIGMERYREELPVYETTRLDTNRAIVNGMIL